MVRMAQIPNTNSKMKAKIPSLVNHPTPLLAITIVKTTKGTPSSVKSNNSVAAQYAGGGTPDKSLTCLIFCTFRHQED